MISFEMVRIVQIVSVCMVSVLFAGLFVITLLKEKSIHPKDIIKHILDSVEEQIQGSGRYEAKKLYLSQIGVNYMMGREVNPEEFFLVKAVTGIFLAAVCGFRFGLIGIVFGGVIGYCGYEILLNRINNAANEKMLPDIKGVFDTLKIKTEGGMFLTSAIAECYKNTRTPRLKQALFEMSGQLIAKNDINDTIDDFGSKFKNKQIDTLCIILKQSMESGRTVEILKDISDQLADMQQAINLRIKNKMESKALTIQLLMYVIILVMCAYGIVIFAKTDMLF